MEFPFDYPYNAPNGAGKCARREDGDVIRDEVIGHSPVIDCFVTQSVPRQKVKHGGQACLPAGRLAMSGGGDTLGLINRG